ncbi:MAG: sulfatase [Acidobacteriia bacterium]|nr:sulfatase [Terriglobia bacterium]
MPTGHIGAELSSPRSSFRSFLLVGAWFGLATGLGEGAGLLLFQRINWERWGPAIHVSKDILWISPVVDLLLSLILALFIGLIARFQPRFPGMRVAAFLFTFLAVYNWLTLTERLQHRSCQLLALGVAVALDRWLRTHQSQATHFWKRTIPWLMAVVVLGFAGIQTGRWLLERNAVAHLPPAAPGAPNILVIVVDTLRADHLSSYGYGRPTTPAIDRLAREGLVLGNAVSTCSWTLPSHASLLTGRPPYEHGMVAVQPMPWLGWGHTSLKGYPTVGEALQQMGYRTGAFSANLTYFTQNVGLGRGFLHFEDYFHSPTDGLMRTLYAREFASAYLHRTEKSWVTRTFRSLGIFHLLGHLKRANAVDREVAQWMDRDRQHPFLAFLNYIDVHEAYGLPASDPRPAWSDHGRIDEYDAALYYVDDQIGRLMQELERRGLDKNTLVIFTSDHGEGLGQHHLQTHGRALYWEQIHVPLVIWYPGHVPAGVRVDRPVSNAAIPATLMTLLGASERNVFPGPDLSRLWKTPEQATDWPDVLSELAQNVHPPEIDQSADQYIPTATTGAMQSLITPRWHLIVHQKLGEQIYDWVRDPQESNNLINTPEGKAAALRMSSQLQGWESASSDGPQE